MLKKFLQFLTADSPATPDPQERIRLATCVILLEVAHADEEFTAEEQAHLLATLRYRFGLKDGEATELVQTAEDARHGRIDLWQFTHSLNNLCTGDEKRMIVEEVWHMICSDGMLDAHEDHFVRRLGKLLHLTHAEVIDAKLKALDAYRSS